MAVDVLAHALPRRQLSLMFGNPAMRSPRLVTASSRSGSRRPHRAHWLRTRSLTAALFSPSATGVVSLAGLARIVLIAGRILSSSGRWLDGGRPAGRRQTA